MSEKDDGFNDGIDKLIQYSAVIDEENNAPDVDMISADGLEYLQRYLSVVDELRPQTRVDKVLEVLRFLGTKNGASKFRDEKAMLHMSKLYNQPEDDELDSLHGDNEGLDGII